MKRSLITGNLKVPNPIQSAEFIERRANLVENLKIDDKSSFVILKSAVKTFSAPDVPHNFRQCSHFRYLTGCLEPNSCLVLNGSKSTLFVHVSFIHF
jgi:Xaa-Pro aminopeptidase